MFVLIELFNLKLLIIAGFGGKLLDSSSYTQEKKHEILEIGCGWGSLAIEDVKKTGCNSNLQKKELKMLAFSYSFSMITTFVL
ncbi:cyclopropane-fatty-acyl-phospholipid synthase [Trifolium repens]|nr:cyclopropane-fatty-acyl-phospholipid synthase [Trifolium repens]